MCKKFFLLIVLVFALFGSLNTISVFANTENNLVVHEFEINGNSESFVIRMDELTVVSGVVENTGDEDAVIELKMNGRYHYERWEIEAGETKEIESDPYEHRGWYTGSFTMSLGDKEIEVEVADKSEEAVTEGTRIDSFSVNEQSEGVRVGEKGELEINASVTNEGDKPLEIKLSLEKDTDARPITQPWPYVELDIEEVRILGLKGHYENSCSYGAFNAIIEPLKREVGHPYNQIPTYMLHYGRGGFMGERSVCGALIGSVAAINLITGEDYRPLGEELIRYYKEEELPTAIWDEYLDMENPPIDWEEYVGERMKGSKSPSVDCGDSLETWYEEAGEEQGPRRNERCGRLTGDVAAKAAELLNEWAKEKGEIESEHVSPSDLEFSKTYEVLPGETIKIEETVPYKWDEFSKYTATLMGGEMKEAVEIVVADQEAEINAFHFVFIFILLFLAGITFGYMIKKCPTE